MSRYSESETQVRGLIEQYSIKCTFPVDGRDEKFVSPAISLSYGFAFNELVSLSLDFETAGFFFRKSESAKAVDKNHGEKAATSLGASLGLNFWEIGKDALQARISAGNTLFSGWHYLYAETGLVWQFRPKPGKFNPYVSFGGRLYLSHQSRFDNHFGLFIGVGVRRNDY